MVRVVVAVAGECESKVRAEAFGGDPSQNDAKQNAVATDRPPDERNSDKAEQNRHGCWMHRHVGCVTKSDSRGGERGHSTDR